MKETFLKDNNLGNHIFGALTLILQNEMNTV